VVRILGEEYRLEAQVTAINGFSTHADRAGLLDYARQTKTASPDLKAVFVVHGEEPASLALAEGLSDLGMGLVAVPRPGETYTL
jgi:metallo-beta-lactamase family protein